MSIDAIWVQVSCNKCAKEIEIELEADPARGGSWPRNTDRLYAHLENKGWTWKDNPIQDLCPPCSIPP